MISYVIAWQGNSMSQEVARGWSCAKAVVHVHVTIVVAHGIPAIEVPLLPWPICENPYH